MSDRIADLLDAIAADPVVIDAVRRACVDEHGKQIDLPQIPDAFWIRRTSIALFARAEHANAALAQIEIRRHGKPQETIEHKGELKIPSIQVTFVAPHK